MNENAGEQLLPADTALQVTDLSKCYRIYEHPRDRLLQALWGRDRKGRAKCFYREFWALQELTFSLGRGQTLGVVGRNGSGKSTLLQLVCGTLQPSQGEVRHRGRVGALLELGSGFNPDFSGLENIFLNAALLGLNQAETEQRLDQILAFADIGEFIHQPVKTYSSGMAMRLAFAVQAHIDPDLLVVDEALAVGDELFQKKCFSHLERLKDRGTAVLLVTHSCPQIIQHCDQALLLHKGRARLLGEPAPVTITYQRLMNASDAEWDRSLSESSDAEDKATKDSWLDLQLQPQSTEIYPSRGGMITDAWIEKPDGERVNTLRAGQDFNIVICYRAEEELLGISFACNLAGRTGQRISGQALPGASDTTHGSHLLRFTAGSEWQISYYFHAGLWPGAYFLSASILRHDASGQHYVHRVIDYRALRILTDEPRMPIGACDLQRRPPELRWLEPAKQP